MKHKANASPDLVRPRVVYERSGRRYGWLMAGLLGLGAVGLAYLGDGWHLQQQNLELRAERDRLLIQVSALDQELGETRQQLVLAQQSSRIDREASEALRREILALQSDQAELEKNLAFYQRVLAPEALPEGVHVSQLELAPAAEANWFNYRLVLAQNAKRARIAQGELRVFVGGVRAGKSREWPLSQLSPALSDNSLPFSFRYFQILPDAQQLGVIQLPEGVQPLYVRVELQLKGKTALERKFNWKLKESL